MNGTGAYSGVLEKDSVIEDFKEHKSEFLPENSDFIAGDTVWDSPGLNDVVGF